MNTAICLCDDLLRVKNSNSDACGYKQKFFTNESAKLDALVCKCCQGVYHTPTILPCTHWFCQSCIRDKNTCPKDESKFTHDECYTLENLQRNIQTQTVRCVNFSKGCNWKGELREIYKHFTDCKMTSIKCKNNCGIALQLNQIARHEKFDCQLRSLKCAFCLKSMLARDMYNHEANSCLKYGGETFWRVKVEKGCNLEVSESFRVNFSNYTMKYYPRKKVMISDAPPQVSCGFDSFTINKMDSLKRFSLPRTSSPIKNEVTTDTVKEVQCISNSHERPAVVFTYCDTTECSTDTSSECSSVGPMPRTLTRAELRLSRRKSEKVVEIPSEDSGFFSSHEGKTSPTVPEVKTRKRRFFKSSAFTFLKKSNKSSWGNKKELSQPENLNQECNLNRSTNGVIEWKINEMAKLLKRSRTCIEYSPAFYTSDKGYKACIRAHFGNGSASFYLCLLRGEHDKRLKWPFKGQCMIKLVNEKSGKEFHSKQQIKGDIPGAKMPKKSNNLCSLCHYICDDDTLLKAGAFENDCLTVIAELKDNTATVYKKNSRTEDVAQIIPENKQPVVYAY